MPTEKEEADFLPSIAAEEFRARERAIQAGQQKAANDKGIVPPVVTSTTKTAEPVAETQEQAKEEIMVPKWRFDEINTKYQELRSQNQPQPKAEVAPSTPAPFPDVEKLVDAKLAPLKVQLEVDQVLKAHSDFQEFAPQVMGRIRSKPSLTLEEAYKLEKFEALQSKAKEEGKKEAYEVIEKKTSLQVESPGRRPAAPSVEDMVRDKSVPLSEIAKMLPRG